MKTKAISCLFCGAKVNFNESNDEYTCIECNANHSSDMFKFKKKKGSRLRLTKIGVLVAVLGALYVVYFFIRRI